MAIHPYLTRLEWDIGAGFVTVGQLVSISSPNDVFNFGDATHLESPGKKREFIQGWGESGEVGFRLIYQGTTYLELRNQIGNFESVPWRLTLPPEEGETVGALITWDGFLTQVMIAEYDRDQDDAIEVECTVKVTGDLAFTPGN